MAENSPAEGEGQDRGVIGKVKGDMNESILLRRLQLTPAHSPTGKTRHLSGDSSGKEITDTYHDSLEGAMAQAEWEFRATEDDWNIVSSG